MWTQRSWFALSIVLGVLGVISPRAAPAAEIEGNTYTSETFGYTITWDSSWFVNEVDTEFGVDRIALINGITYAEFVAFPLPSAEFCLASMEASLVVDNGITDIADIVGEDGVAIRGADGQHAFAAVSGTWMLDDSTPLELGIYLDCQTIVPGESALALTASMPLELFDQQLPAVRTLLDGVALPGAAPGPESPDIERMPPGDTTDPTAEPAPAFVTRRWRISLAAVARDDAIPVANLKPKDGKDWLVLVADVTNWSDQDATLKGSDLKLVFPDDDRRYEFAPNSSRAASRELGLEVRDLEMTVPIKAGETARIALVFLIPEDRPAPVLHGMLSEVGLPLDDGQGAGVLNNLPEPVAAPALQSTHVVDVVDGDTIELQVVGTEETIRARLIGVDEPAQDSCAGDELISWLTGLVDDPSTVLNPTVWIERDPSPDKGRTEAVYLWREESSGMRTLVNQEVVAKGYAEPRDRDNATFAVWIAAAGETARAKHLGIWGHCRLTFTTLPT